jgi:hypothetical protein
LTRVLYSVDYLDKGAFPFATCIVEPLITLLTSFSNSAVDFIQEHGLGQGAQNNESAIEQAKDEQISDAIRRAYKSATGSDIPVKDKS